MIVLQELHWRIIWELRVYIPSTITLENHLGDVTECIVDLENTVENRCAKDMDCARDEALLFLEACGITDVEILEEGPLGYSTFESARPIDFNGYCFQFTRA